MKKGSNVLNDMKHEIHKFGEFITGIMKSKELKRGSQIKLKNFHKDFTFELKILWGKLGTSINIYNKNKRYGITDDYPKEIIESLFWQLPKILTLICYEYTEVAVDVHFFMSVAASIENSEITNFTSE